MVVGCVCCVCVYSTTPLDVSSSGAGVKRRFPFDRGVGDLFDDDARSRHFTRFGREFGRNTATARVDLRLVRVISTTLLIVKSPCHLWLKSTFSALVSLHTLSLSSSSSSSSAILPTRLVEPFDDRQEEVTTTTTNDPKFNFSFLSILVYTS